MRRYWHTLCILSHMLLYNQNGHYKYGFIRWKRKFTSRPFNFNWLNSKAANLKNAVLAKMFDIVSNDKLLDVGVNNNVTFVLEKLNFESYKLIKLCSTCHINFERSNPFVYLNVTSEMDLKWQLNNLRKSLSPKKYVMPQRTSVRIEVRFQWTIMFPIFIFYSRRNCGK